MLCLAPASAWAADGPLRDPIGDQAKAKRGKRKPKPRVKGSKPGKPNESVRRILTGDRPEHSTAEPRESAELKAMRELDAELFPPIPAPASAPWAEALELPKDGPEVDASGMPRAAGRKAADEAGNDEDLSWLAKLKKPDFPVRFEPSVVRYLRYYRDKPRGQRLIKAWVKKSGRYRTAIRKLLNEYKMPEDVLWLALVESAFDSTIHSHAGAAGLWQFMPATGRIYGLTVTRSVDERLDPERATHAALRHLKDLHKRFGTWELAFAAYNMGYGGLLASIRRFNTNDYWELRRLEAGLPYETALYVPKIMAIAIAAKNCDVFGCDKVTLDPPEPFGDEGEDTVSAAPGVTLEDLADATGTDEAKLAELNPHLIGSRLPPVEHSTLPRKSWTLYVPEGKGAKAADEIPATGARRNLAIHRVRWGETLEALAIAVGTSAGYLQDINDLYPHESPRPGKTVFIPAGRTPKQAKAIAAELEPTAVVPAHAFAYADRRRVFYEPVFGDELEDVARMAKVSPAEIRRWNHLDARAKLQHGMLLQLHVPKGHHPSDALLYEAEDVEVLTVESDRFFEHVVGGRGRQRIEVVCGEGDTWRSIGKKYGVSLGTLERINHRSRRSHLEPGDRVVVYAERDRLHSLKEPALDQSDPKRAQEAAHPSGPTLTPAAPAPASPAADAPTPEVLTPSSSTRQAPSGPAS